jgi:hypothetical protein
MTIQTNVLEMWLARLHTRARQLHIEKIAPGGSLLDDGRVWFDKPEVVAFWRAMDELDAELRRVLRRFGGLERELAQMQSQLAAVPQDQRWREQSRIDSFENDLSRVARKATLLASALIELRRRGGEVSATDLAQAIHHIGTEMGKSLDLMRLRRTVQQVSTRPAYQPVQGTDAELGGVVETLFVLIAMVSALARRRGSRSG